MFEKNLTLIMLFDIYGELLTEAQKTMFDLYYNDDLSLAEIAENTGISRQGARDSIKRAEETLLSYEQKLHLAEKIDGIQKKRQKHSCFSTSSKESTPPRLKISTASARSLAPSPYNPSPKGGENHVPKSSRKACGGLQKV